MLLPTVAPEGRRRQPVWQVDVNTSKCASYPHLYPRHECIETRKKVTQIITSEAKKTLVCYSPPAKRSYIIVSASIKEDADSDFACR